MHSSLTKSTRPMMTPTTSKNRIVEIDILRGFALFGILVVNMLVFSSDYIAEHKIWSDTANLTFLRIVELFIENKFYRIYSFLFGLGFALFIIRGESKGSKLIKIYIRRLLILTIFAVIHTLTWEGDILFQYAILGFLLIPFRKLNLKRIFVWIVIFSIVPLTFQVYDGINEAITKESKSKIQQVDTSEIKKKQQSPSKRELLIEVLQNGSYYDVAKQNANRFISYSLKDIWWLFEGIFLMFLIGFYVGKRGYFQNILKYKILFRRFFLWTFPVGLTAMIVTALISDTWHFEPIILFQSKPKYIEVIAFAIDYIGKTVLSLSYIAGLMWLLTSAKWNNILRHISPIGRMPLTNYLLQTFICVIIFYGYGFGFHGHVSPLVGLLLTILIYIAQVFFSKWWLKRYQFGPMEWIWRYLTYRKIQSMRI